MEVLVYVFETQRSVVTKTDQRNVFETVINFCKKINNFLDLA